MEKDIDIEKIIGILKGSYKMWRMPVVSALSMNSKDPFKILIATLLSLRTKDETTREAALRLFSKAATPMEMLKLGEKNISEIIYPVGFYRKKARNIIEISEILIRKYGGRVPDSMDALLSLPGVGRKTANLVLTEGFDKRGICVDTHVHRISNRIGYVKTKSPEATEMELRKKLPLRYWKIYNPLLVSLGQNICRPNSPLCSMCPIERYCKKVGVKRRR